MLINQNEYLEIVETVKAEICGAQYKAAVHVNREMILLYYNIGQVINRHKTWGNKFIDNLANDIKLSFPNATGYSVRNLKYMAAGGDLSRRGICAAGCCTNSVGTYRHSAGQGSKRSDAQLVH